VTILRLSARIWIGILGICLVGVLLVLLARWFLTTVGYAQAPTVLSLVPAAGTSDVPLRSDIRVRFSTPMNRASVERAIRFEPPLQGRFSWDNDRQEVIFLPDQALSAGITYTISIDQTARGWLYSALSEPFQASFFTTPAPTVLSALPTGSDVALQSPIALIFSRPMVEESQLNRTTQVSELHFMPPLASDMRWIDQTTLLIQPQQPLPPATTILVNVDANLSDVQGTPMGQAYQWSFATQAPSLLEREPSADAKGVGLHQPLKLVFSQPFPLDKIEQSLHITPTLSGSFSSEISGTVQIVRFQPDTAWLPDTTYRVRLDALLPEAGDRLLESQEWSFSTAPQFSLVGRYPGQGQSLPTGQSLRLIFATPVDTSLISSSLRLEPEAQPLSVTTNGAEVRIQADLQANTAYTLTLDPQLTDINGTPLGREYRLNFVTAPAPASMSLPDVQGRFVSVSADEVVRLNLQRINTTSLQVQLYQLDEATLLRMFGFSSSLWNDFQPTRYNLPLVRAWPVSFDGDLPNVEQRSELLISPQETPTNLAAGAYYLRLMSQEGSRLDLVLLVSRVKLSLVSGSKQVLVFASDANGTPVSNLPLRLYAGSSVIAQGQSDSDGVWMVDRASSSGPYLVLADAAFAAGDSSSAAIVHSAWTLAGAYAQNAERDDYRLAIAIDRNFYQPSDTLELRGLLRAISSTQVLTPTSETSLELTLRRASGTEIVARGSAQVSADGNVYGTLSFKDLNPGNYIVRAALGSLVRELPLRIVAAQQQPFVVELFDSDTRRLRLHARRPDGEPIVGAQVEWLIQAEGYVPLAPNNLPPQMSVADDEERLTAPFEYTGSGTTDFAGDLLIDLPSEIFSRTLQLNLSADIYELPKLRSHFEQSWRWPALPLQIGIQPQRQVWLATQPPVIDFMTVGSDGRAVANQDFQVEVLRRVWEPELREVNALRRALRSDEQGIVKLTLDLREPGEYRIIATANDSFGREVRSARSIWVLPGSASASFANWNQSENELLIVPDQKRYLPSSQAELFVALAKPQARLLVVLEQNGVISSTLRTLNAGELLPIALAAGGDASVTLIEVDAPQRRVGRVRLALLPELTPLQVQISEPLVREANGPSLSNTLSFSVTVQDQQAAPVSADLLVAVAPPQHLPLASIVPAQLSQLARPLLPGVSDTSAIELGAQISGPSVAPSLPNRSRISHERPYGWLLAQRSDANGQAHFSLELPPELSQWRISVLASSAATSYGQASQEVMVTPSFVAEPVLPDLLYEGDQAKLGLFLRNSSPFTQSYRLELSSAHLRIPQAGQDLLLPAGAEQLLTWSISTVQLGNAELRYSLQIDGTATRELTRTLRIEPLPRAQLAAETLIGPIEQTLNFSSTQELGPQQIRLLAAPDQFAVFAHSQTRLAQKTDRTIEEEASLFLLSALLQQTTSLSQSLDLQQTLQTSYNRLVSQQLAGGGWARWPEMGSEAFLSAYVLEALSYAQASGFDLPESLRENGLAFLQRQLQQSKEPNLRAYLLYVLSLYGVEDDQMLRSLLQPGDTSRLQPDGLAYLSMQLASNEALGVLARLEALRQELDDERVLWHLGRERFVPHSPTSTSAIVVQALARAERNPSLQERARQGLLRAWSVDGWASAYETARVALALLPYQNYEQDDDQRVTVGLRANGSLLAERSSTDAQLLQIERTLPQPLERLDLSLNAATVQQALLAYQLLGGLDSPSDPSVMGLRVVRSFHDPQSGALLANGALQQGQLVEVRLILIVPEELGFASLLETRNAAFETLQTQATAPFVLAQQTTTHLVWNALRLAPGIYTQSYLARIGLAGALSMPSPQVGPLYQPSEILIAPSQQLVVRENMR
jgi:Large extracellular alpha-helical protein